MSRNSAMRWFRTIRDLRPVQIYGRLWHRFYSPKPLTTSGTLAIRESTGVWVIPIAPMPSISRLWSFSFLNEVHELRTAADWDNPDQSKLWRYNLHYFHDLNAADSVSRSDWHLEWLKRWVNENPPAHGTGWEPYPTSLRIVNWVKWSLAGNPLPPQCAESLTTQVRWLTRRMEFHLLGNHLFMNAKALIFAGLYFEGKEADQWIEKGFRILLREIPEQILDDGGQFERSPMYHALALEDMLDLWNVTSTYPEALPYHLRSSIFRWPQLIQRMRHWLWAMCHPDGEISFFNDAAFGIAPSPVALDEYATRLSLSTEPPGFERLTHLGESGYFRVENADMVALLDTAPIGPDYLPGHAHADTLSFELSLFNQRVLVNSGTSCYGTDDERHRQRGTAAHNTVILNDENSSEVWAGFRVGRKARPTIEEISMVADSIIVSASHDGYLSLPGKNRHRRKWQFGERSVLIEDEVTGHYQSAIAHFHFHPEVNVAADKSQQRAMITLPGGQHVEMRFGGGEVTEVLSTWHPEFGISEPNTCLAVEFNGSILQTTISWSVSS